MSLYNSSVTTPLYLKLVPCLMLSSLLPKYISSELHFEYLVSMLHAFFFVIFQDICRWWSFCPNEVLQCFAVNVLVRLLVNWLVGWGTPHSWPDSVCWLFFPGPYYCTLYVIIVRLCSLESCSFPMWHWKRNMTYIYKWCIGIKKIFSLNLASAAW